MFLFLLGLLTLVNGQFKVVDSSSFRMKKGVSNNASNIALVQINHYVDQTADQSRSFSVNHRKEDSNLIKVHIEYKNQIDTSDKDSDPPKPSNLLRIMASNRNRESPAYL